MARISGVDLPRDKRVEIALTYIFGIGRKTATDIIAATGINPDTRVKDLTEDDVSKLREYIDRNVRLKVTSEEKQHLISRDLLKLVATVAYATERAFP